mgnify:CR=1 FL=1
MEIEQQDYVSAVRDYELLAETPVGRKLGGELGELVLLASADRGRVPPPAFEGLSDEVLVLAGELPGFHPFLRKYVRRLAHRLP